MRGTVASAISGVAVVFALSGCGAEIDGSVALIKNADGSVDAMARLCEREPAGATLYAASPADTDPVVARWMVKGSDEPHTARWAVVTVESQLADNAAATLDPSGRYTLIAGPEDESFAAAPLTFRTSDLASLDSGELLYPDPERPDNNARGDEASFVESACRN